VGKANNEKNVEKETEFGPRIERSRAWKTFETIFLRRPVAFFHRQLYPGARVHFSFSHASQSGENKNPNRK